MHQLAQKLKDGTMNIIEAPVPAPALGTVLIKNHYSLISAGTEGSTVKAARKSLIGKAKERPQQVKQVLDVLKSQGPVQTYRAVMKKLDAFSPLGYSCVGEVIGLGNDITSFQIGDFAACGGLTACHAEIVAVPVNLCVKLPPDTDMKQAAYNTLGAIALQGVRQADLRLGETCAVIGLGLLGQLTCLLLRASGIRVIGIDVSPSMADMAAKHCADISLTRNETGILGRIEQFTNGIGCDAVIITAATDSSDPINFAGAVARKRGTVVVVGAVPTGFDRDPHYYRKELQVRMSCSYGPGRYDPNYEEKGQDYPVGYVRWTENRNMQAFQELIASQKIDVSFLTTHTFKLDEAPAAYDMIVNRSEASVGILIEYDRDKLHDIRTSKVFLKQNLHYPPSSVSVGFIGAGSYAQSHLLPNIPKSEKILLKGVMTATSASARSAGERFGFEFCTGNAGDIIDNDAVNTVFIATRHNTHAHYVKQALQAGKHVFVEKPLCLTNQELEELSEIYNKQESQAILMVGYNRRFAPLTKMIKDEFREGPMSMTYRINAGSIPSDSWIQDAEIGGGRIIGEVCHFVDFLTYINGSLPVSVYASAMTEPHHLNDTVTVTLTYQNGSIGTISYFANGDKSLPKERVEIYANGCTAVLDDFKQLNIYANGKKKEKKLLNQDKGQKAEVKQFIDALLNGKGEMIPFGEIYSASRVTFAVIESIQRGEMIKMNE